MIDVDIKGKEGEPLSVTLSGPVAEIIEVLVSGVPPTGLEQIRDAIQAELDRRKVVR